MIIQLCLVFAFCSCNKKKKNQEESVTPIDTELKNGFPENVNAIDGYMYSSVTSNNYSSYDMIDNYCAFNEPATNLTFGYDHSTDNNGSVILGNISVGSITFSNFMTLFSNVTGGNRLNYSSSTTVQNFTTINPSWKFNGNGPFSKMDLNITRNYPIFTSMSSSGTVVYDTVNINKGYSYDVSKDISNYDSVVVSINSNNKTIKRATGNGASIINFSSNELNTVFGTNSYYGSMNVMAYNYSNKTINKRVYLFELSRKRITNVIFKY